MNFAVLRQKMSSFPCAPLNPEIPVVVFSSAEDLPQTLLSLADSRVHKTEIEVLAYELAKLLENRSTPSCSLRDGEQIETIGTSGRVDEFRPSVLAEAKARLNDMECQLAALKSNPESTESELGLWSPRLEN